MPGISSLLRHRPKICLYKYDLMLFHSMSISQNSLHFVNGNSVNGQTSLSVI